MRAMARTRSITSIENEITKTTNEMLKVKQKYDRLASKLSDLQGEKLACETKVIMDAYSQSEKSLSELMTFLQA